MELHELIKNLYGVDKLEGYSDEDIAFLKEMFGDMPEVLEDYYRKAGRTEILKHLQDEWILPEHYKKWEWLKENNAAVLKYMIETAAKQDKSFIGRNDWPKGVNGGAKAYKQIRKFLGKYGENLVSKGGRGHGVYWKGTPRLILGETEKSQRDTEEVFNGIIEDISQKEKIKKEEKFGREITDLLAETARELCEKGRRSGRLIAPANIPKSQKVKLPELHAEAELTQGEQIKTLRQLIDELSSDGQCHQLKPSDSEGT